MYYKDGTRFKAQIFGDSISNQLIKFTLNGEQYTRRTDSSGNAYLSLNLAPGSYYIETNCGSYFNSNQIYILSTIKNAKDYSMFYKDGTKFSITIVNSNGNPTVGDVSFNINGLFYYRHTKTDGQAKLNINLAPGVYIITTDFNGCKQSNTITVKSTFGVINDLTKYFKSDSKYTVKLVCPNKNAQKINFNINGVFYKRTTNSNGEASLPINLGPGDYIITAEHNGLMTSNNIKVLPTLSGSDLSKEVSESASYNVKMLNDNGYALSGAKVIFNVNGIIYHRTTNNYGEASLPINLPVGIYVITASCNEAVISNKIIVKYPSTGTNVNPSNPSKPHFWGLSLLC